MEEPCRDCITDDKYENAIKTNADRLRAMTDEEIVNQIAEIAAWDRHCNKVGILAWLKQEVE